MRFGSLLQISVLGLSLAGCASHDVASDADSHRTPSSTAQRVGYNGQCPNLVGTWNCQGGYQIIFRGSSDPTYLNYSGDDWKVTGNKETVQKDGQPLLQQITCADGTLYRKYWVGSMSPNPEQYSIQNDDDVMTAQGTKCTRKH